MLLERDEGREEGGEINIDARERSSNWLPPIGALIRDRLHLDGDGTCNVGMCPDWVLNPQTFGYR